MGLGVSKCKGRDKVSSVSVKSSFSIRCRPAEQIQRHKIQIQDYFGNSKKTKQKKYPLVFGIIS